MGGVLRVPQVVQREVGRDDQRLAAAVTAVNHIENLFQPVFRSALHNQNVEVNTIDKLCNILNCNVEDIMTHYPDDNVF